MKDYKSEWAYPLTNVSKCGNGQEPKPCATVKDADGVVILNFIGIPWRSNNEAIAMATKFCERMNEQHNKSVGNASKAFEALKLIRKELLRDSGFGPVSTFHTTVDKITQEALSAPPRNCDIFSKAVVLEVLDNRSFSKEDTIEWLFEEVKGEVK